jgi:hypothetical protein
MNERLADVESISMTQNFLVLRDIGLRIEQIYSMEFIHY